MVSLPRLPALAQVPVRAPAAPHEIRLCGKFPGKDLRHHLFQVFGKCHHAVLGRLVIDGIVILEIEERCPLRQFPVQLLNCQRVQVELDIFRQVLLRDAGGFR